jgi:hypothetical protein
LQPLDVVVFSPLSTAYSQELVQHLHHTQGLIPVKKADFFPLFWPAYDVSFTSPNILKAFEATGISPANAEVILKRFTSTPSGQDGDPEFAQHGDGSSWNELRKLFEVTVKDTAGDDAKRLSTSLHSLQVQNELLNHENQGLRAALVTKRKNSKKRKPLDLQQRQEYHGGAVFWSPRKVREARARESVKQREDEAEKLRKAETKDLRAAASLYKRKMAEEARALREQAKEQRKKDAEAKAAEREAARAQKQQEKEAATTRKLAEQANKATRTASQSRVKESHSQRGAVGGASGAAAEPPQPQLPPRTTTRGRQINLPQKFK